MEWRLHTRDVNNLVVMSLEILLQIFQLLYHLTFDLVTICANISKRRLFKHSISESSDCGENNWFSKIT